MPRPAYIAAHSPAGPAPTMITSYGCLTLSLIGPQFSIRNPQLQSRRLGIAGERSLQLLERGPAHHRHAMPVPPLLMEQRGRRLDQSLPNACRGLVAATNNRTPDGFQGLVGEPVFAGVEEVTGALERRPADLGSHPAAACAAPIRNRFRAPWHELIVPTNTAAAAPLSPAARTIASPSRTASTAKVPTPNT